MKSHLSEQAIEAIKVYSISGIIVCIAYFLLKNVGKFTGFLGTLFGALSPFLIGFGIAFVLIPLRRLLERRVLNKLEISERRRRLLAVILCIVILLLGITLFFVILIPQVISSAQTLISSLDTYVTQVSEWLELLFAYTGDPQQASSLQQTLNQNMQEFSRNISNYGTQILREVYNYSISFVNGAINFFIGLIVAFYFMMDQEKFKRQLSRLTLLIFGRKTALRLVDLARVTSRMFNSFIFGKALDSLVIGIITWICMMILRMPYAPLIAVIVGVTNMIPVFGPFIGAIPCAFIIFIVSPIKAGIFLIFIVILQQIDGNILGPMILGNSVGLPAIWIMFAIFVGGSLFGLLGMFFGVPIFSVIYYEVRNRLNKHLKEESVEQRL